MHACMHSVPIVHLHHHDQSGPAVRLQSGCWCVSRAPSLPPLVASAVMCTPGSFDTLGLGLVTNFIIPCGHHRASARGTASHIALQEER